MSGDPFGMAALAESDTASKAVTSPVTPDKAADQQEHAAVTGVTGVTPPTGRRTSWTAAELMAMDFPEPRWAVPGVIAEGVTLLAGPPKIGKSWLALGTGLAVASGGMALSAVKVEPGDVLYLALEDTPRRLQRRLAVMLGSDPAPDSLTLATACPPLPDGGAERIAAWLDQHPGTRLVIIDVLARIRGTAPAGTSAYDSDYQAVVRAKDIADQHGVAVVLVHHVRKAEADDFLDTVSGTNGLTGAADQVLVLKRSRGKADAVLHLTGRDVEEAEHALKFTAAIGTWELLEGSALEHTLSGTRAAIYGWLQANGSATPKQLADALGLEWATVRQTCGRMIDAGQLDTDGNGLYYLSHLSQGNETAGQGGGLL